MAGQRSQQRPARHAIVKILASVSGHHLRSRRQTFWAGNCRFRAKLIICHGNTLQAAPKSEETPPLSNPDRPDGFWLMVLPFAQAAMHATAAQGPDALPKDFHISTWLPSSTTRLVGNLKSSIAVAELAIIQANSRSRQIAMPGRLEASNVWRER